MNSHTIAFRRLVPLLLLANISAAAAILQIEDRHDAAVQRLQAPQTDAAVLYRRSDDWPQTSHGRDKLKLESSQKHTDPDLRPSFSILPPIDEGIEKDSAKDDNAQQPPHQKLALSRGSSLEKDMTSHEGKKPCSICHSSIEQGDSHLTNCGHEYHVACLQEWSRKRRNRHWTCPDCRNLLETKDRLGTTYELPPQVLRPPRSPSPSPSPSCWSGFLACLQGTWLIESADTTHHPESGNALYEHGYARRAPNLHVLQMSMGATGGTYPVV